MEVNPRIGSGDEMSKKSESEGGGILLGWGTREPLFCLVSFHSPPPIYTMWALLLYASIPASSGVIYLTEESEHTAAWVSPGCRRCCVLASLSVIPVSLAVPGVDDGDLVKEATLRGYIDGGSDWTLVRGGYSFSSSSSSNFDAILTCFACLFNQLGFRCTATTATFGSISELEKLELMDRGSVTFEMIVSDMGEAHDPSICLLSSLSLPSPLSSSCTF
ncbi:hypothetical protein GW17_00023098 [Ensete ventricosum]|nr:hypothetical protein GW17_00023098 [Ensete ventricosum]